MFNRVLVNVCSENELDYLIKYSNLLQKEYNVQIVGLYVKDVRKYEIIPPAIEGMVVDNTTNILMKEWDENEKKLSLKLKEKFIKEVSNSKFIIEDGVTYDIVLESLKGFDVLLLFKDKKLSHDLKTYLRLHYKPIILVPAKEEYKINNAVFANDEEGKTNKSLFSFLEKFNKVKKIFQVKVNKDYESKEFVDYINLLDLNFEYIEKKGNEAEGILDELLERDILIMGDLKYPFMFEKITGKVGINLLEKSNIPIFIG